MSFDGGAKRLIRAKGALAPFRAVAAALQAADVTLGNLECALSSRGSSVPGKTFTFRGDPLAASGLAAAGFDLVSLANNHARDFGPIALRDTMIALRAAGVAWAGAGSDKAAAWTPALIERGGARIAFLAFSEIGPSNFAATSARSGTAYTFSAEAVRRAIKAAHAQADYVIVSFHWGVELASSPTARQVSTGRAAINAGADAVLSHHPHVIEGIEFYRRGLIAYSLGNFVFSPGNAKGHDSIVLHLSLSSSGVSAVTVTPAHIGSNTAPTPATGSTARRILAVVAKTSRARGSHVSVAGTVASITR
jgi:poly-gamma-glutamate synthesis protein (capsule biosynthesis protein)